MGPTDKCCQICEFCRKLKTVNICTRKAPVPRIKDGLNTDIEKGSEVAWYARQSDYPQVHPDMVCGDFVFDIRKVWSYEWRRDEAKMAVERMKMRVKKHCKEKAVLRRQIKKLTKQIERLTKSVS